MLEIFIAALLALGIITSPAEATQKHIDDNKAEIELYIIDTEIDSM